MARCSGAAAAACAYVHVHLVYARDVHEGAVYENAVHSFARARAYNLARHRGRLEGRCARVSAGAHVRVGSYIS